MRPQDFVDMSLSRAIGSPTREVAEAIDAECRAALEAVVGPQAATVDDVVGFAAKFTPWVFDLGRGLHWHARRGPCPTAAVLIVELARDSVDPSRLAEHAQTVDMAGALHHGRLTEQVFGVGALQIPSEALRERYPWFDATVLGLRVGLALDLLRLTAPWG